MPDSSKVLINEIDNTQTVAAATTGVNGLSMVTKRGPFGKEGVEIEVTSWLQFTRIFGGEIPGKLGPTLSKRAFARGSRLRINRILHYTTISDPASFDADFSAPVATSIITYSGQIVTGQTVSVTVNGVVTTQPFVTDSFTTLRTLANKLKTTISGYISDAYAQSATVLVLVPLTVAITPTSSVTGGTPPTAAVTSVSTIKAGTVDAFALNPKYPGADYNNLMIYITAAKNGDSRYFDLNIMFRGEEAINETYSNLIINGNPTAATSTYLSKVVKGSQLVNVVYNDLSGTTGQVRPNNIVLKYGAGTDGTAPTDADYNGDSAAKNGWFAFDGVDDITLLGAADRDVIGVHIAGAAYANNRKDIVYVGHISNDYITEAQVITEKDSYNIDSSYAAFTVGGLIIVDPFTSQNLPISELGDIFGASAYSDQNFGPWYSFAGTRRGLINNALGVVNNFGAAGNTAGLDLIANHQIIAVINRNKKIQIAGNYTGQQEETILSWLSVRKFLNYLKKSLGPTLENFLEEPNDFATWKLIYQAVKPFLENLKTKRAMYDYRWEGDQFATNLQQLVVNNPTDVGNGKYKINNYIQPTPALREIELNIILTPTGVSFEDNLGTSL